MNNLSKRTGMTKGISHGINKLFVYSLLKRLNLISQKTFDEKFVKYSAQLKKELSIVPPEKPRQRITERACVGILTPGSTAFIGRKIAALLKEWNIDVEFLRLFNVDSRKWDEKLYIIITPMIYSNNLPPNYIAIQMEQTITDRWFTPEYTQKLNNALSVADYSLYNFKYLKKNNIAAGKLHYLPIAPDAAKFSSLATRKTDVLFYGAIKSERRQKALAYLEEELPIKRVHCQFDDGMLQLLDDTKIVINIHYYENAMLETTRVSEAISRGCLVISETSINDAEYPALCELIDFVPVGDFKGINKRVKYWLAHPEELENRIRTNCEKSKQLHYAYAYMLGRILHYHGILGFESLYQTCKNAYSITESVILHSAEAEHDLNSHAILKEAGFTYFPALVGKTPEKANIATLCFIARRALERSSQCVCVCDSQVNVSADFYQRFEEAKKFLISEKIDVLCCVLKPARLAGGAHAESPLSIAKRSCLTLYSRKALNQLACKTDMDSYLDAPPDNWYTNTHKDLKIQKFAHNLGSWLNGSEL